MQDTETILSDLSGLNDFLRTSKEPFEKWLNGLE